MFRLASTPRAGKKHRHAVAVGGGTRYKRGMPDQSVHEVFQSRESVKSSSDRAFGFVFTAVFAIIGLAPLVGGGAVRGWSLAIGALFAALSLLRPRTLAPLNRLWTRFGLLLHHIVNPVVMGVMFFLVVTPIGLMMRALGKRPLNIDLVPDAESYWIERNPPGPAPETMKQQF